MTKISEILRDARSLLIDKGWCQRAAARDVQGWPVLSDDSQAVCYCSTGAIHKAMARHNINSIDNATMTAKAIQYLSYKLPKDRLVRWNDQPRRTKQQVLDRFEKAILRAEARGE